jgi:hypothetical protein
MALNATRLLKATANNLSEKSGHLKYTPLAEGFWPMCAIDGNPAPMNKGLETTARQNAFPYRARVSLLP